MFDENALKLIQDTAIQSTVAQNAVLIGTATLATSGNFKLHDIERFMPLRRRFAATMETSSLADFVAYVKKKAEPISKVPCFISPESLFASAIFDLGDATAPGHGEDRAKLVMKCTAPYAAMLSVDGGSLSQRALADFLVDWKDYLSPYDATGTPGEHIYAPLTRALEAIRSVTVVSKSEAESSVSDFKGSVSTFDEIEAKSRATLPSGFEFTGVPHLGLPPVTFLLRLAVLPGDGKSAPVLRLRIVQKEMMQERVLNDFKQVLISELEDVADITIGDLTL